MTEKKVAFPVFPSQTQPFGTSGTFEKIAATI